MKIDDTMLRRLGRQTWYLIDLDVIASNFRDMRTIVGSGVKIAAVLKADAYGHGAVIVAGTVLEAGADMLAVATLSEALELRRVYSEAKIVVMGHTPDVFADVLIKNGIMPTVFDAGNAAAFSAAARAAGRCLSIHIKLDTGMNRLGIKAYEDPVGAIAKIASMQGLFVESVFTHLALRDRASDVAQFALFEEILAGCAARGIATGLRHVGDSIGAVRYPEFRLDMVRVGAALFGVRPGRMGPEYDAFPFLQASTFTTRIARIRHLDSGEMVSYDDSWKAPAGGTMVATLPVGYADGYPRRFGNRAQVSIRGRRAPVIGLVCMDQTMVDVGGIEGVREGDDVILLGGGAVSLNEASEWGSTNRNELLCGIGRRVPRLYVREDRLVASDDRLATSTIRWF
ncbi:MAG: alanine racemase [Spirochaetae bacterium HGW-Spirochaetae-9]|nr:MAG: alanine racemase [Spirochaetae bacterium HGW-Spirochaetae-9]